MRGRKQQKIYWSEDPVLALLLSRRESECGGVRRETETDPGVSQHPSGQPPAPGPPQQAPGPGQPAQPGRSPATGTGLCRVRLQAVASQVRRLHPKVAPSFAVSPTGLVNWFVQLMRPNPLNVQLKHGSPFGASSVLSVSLCCVSVLTE